MTVKLNLSQVSPVRIFAQLGIMTFHFLLIFNITPAVSNILSPWTNTAALNVERVHHMADAYNGYIYVAGGHDNFTPLATVEYSEINADGSLAGWNFTTPMPSIRRNAGVLIHNGYIYVVGGSTNSANQLCTVFVAPINPANGSLGTWTSTSNINQCREHPGVAVSGNNIYVIGGSDNVSVRYDSVEFATINGDGTLGSWSYTTSLIDGRNGPRTIAFNGYVYAMSGNNNSSI